MKKLNKKEEGEEEEALLCAARETGKSNRPTRGTTQDEPISLNSPSLKIEHPNICPGDVKKTSAGCFCQKGGSFFFCEDRNLVLIRSYRILGGLCKGVNGRFRSCAVGLGRNKKRKKRKKKILDKKSIVFVLF